MEQATRVHILDKAACVALCTTIFRKGMNPC